MASSTSATNVGQNPRPKPRFNESGNRSARSAKDGTARPMLTIDCAAKPPRFTWPKNIAAGSAIAPATTTDAPDKRMCSTDRWMIPRSPHQLDDVVTKSAKSWNAPISVPPVDEPTA